jgi:hypothetical protein
MPIGLRDSLSEGDRVRLKAAMNWVIPPDSSPGAGTDAGVAHLLDLIHSLDSSVADAYQRNLRTLSGKTLADPSNAFAAMFAEHVRDVYYAYPDTGSWADIGFVVTDA